jgi:hypothetical protein
VVVHVDVAFFDPAKTVGGPTVAFEVMGRNEIAVPNGEFSEQPIVFWRVLSELKKLGPEKFGRAENKDIDCLSEGKGVDRCDRSTDDDQRIAGTAIAATAGYPRRIEGAEEVDGVEFKAAAPCQEVQRSEWDVSLDGATRTVRWRKEPRDRDVRDRGGELDGPLVREGRKRHVVAVRVSDPDSEPADGRQDQPGTFFGVQ